MTFLERRQRVTDTAGMLLLLEMTSPSFSGPLRAASDTVDWVSQGVTYIGVPFGFKLPDDVAGQTPRAVLEMANVGTGFADELERMQPGEMPSCKLIVTDRADPDTHVRTILLPIIPSRK